MKSIKSIDTFGNIQYKNEKGEFHREDGPAVEYTDGFKAWLINGKRHREDGPTIVYSDGDVEYYLDDIFYYSKEEYEQEVIKIRLGRILDL